MATFGELCNIMRQKRENEKAINPMEILCQIGELGFQIYANDPLQFIVMYREIHKRVETHQDADLKFSEHEAMGVKKLVVTVVNPALPLAGQEKAFGLDEEIHRLTIEFPNEIHIAGIVDSLTAYKTNEL